MVEDIEEEILIGVSLALGKCTRPCVTRVEEVAKFLLSQVEINRYIVVIALKRRTVEALEGRIEIAPGDLVEEKETEQLSSYWIKLDF